jgi:hypothetical protein
MVDVASTSTGPQLNERMKYGKASETAHIRASLNTFLFTSRSSLGRRLSGKTLEPVESHIWFTYIN